MPNASGETSASRHWMSDTPRDRPELVRLIAQQLGGSPPLNFTHKQQWLLKRAEDILAELESARCVVVPAVPTEKMVQASVTVTHPSPRRAWNAMLTASPYRAP